MCKTQWYPLTLVPVLSTVPRLRSTLFLQQSSCFLLPWDPPFSVPKFFTLKPHFHFFLIYEFFVKTRCVMDDIALWETWQLQDLPRTRANRELLNKRVSGFRGIHRYYYKGSIWSWYGLKSCWPSRLIRAWRLSLSISVQTRSKTFVLEPSH